MEKFSTEKNGYSKAEVNKFIGDTIVQLETMLSKVNSTAREIKQKELEVEELKNKLGYYKGIEDTLKKALYSAEEASNNIKRNAITEANLIVQEAKQNASRILNDSLLRSEQLEIQNQLLEKNLRVFKKKLKLIIEQQLTIVEEIDDIELN